MLQPETKQRIIDLTRGLWERKIKEQEFTGLLRGKERGHRMADFVDDRTCGLLNAEMQTAYEADPAGSKRKRSMGDIWVRDGGIYHPVNVKTGEQGRNGQPNMVAMSKLLNYLLNHWIDSYYLLIIKFSFDGMPDFRIYLADLLDIRQHLTFDAGPGQIMLREQAFYEAVPPERPLPEKSIEDKITELFDLFEDGERRTQLNRERRQRVLRKSLDTFMSQPVHPVDQSGLKFVP